MKTTAKKPGRIQVEIKPDPRFPETHRRVVVTTARGYCYFATWAEPWPDEATVRQAWRETRSDFQPYNCTL
jgi:hypothetical protein